MKRTLLITAAALAVFTVSAHDLNGRNCELDESLSKNEADGTLEDASLEPYAESDALSWVKHHPKKMTIDQLTSIGKEHAVAHHHLRRQHNIQIYADTFARIASGYYEAKQVWYLANSGRHQNSSNCLVPRSANWTEDASSAHRFRIFTTRP